MTSSGHGPRHTNWVVLKYGGTSVSTAANWKTISDTVLRRMDEGFRPFVVCSAATGISNLLERLVSSAVRGDYIAVLQEITKRHEVLAEDLSVDLQRVCGEDLEQLERLAHGISLIGATSPALQARIMAFGEVLSTKLGHAFLADRGVPSEWHDARTMLSAVRNSQDQEGKRYLSAVCAFDPDPELAERLERTEGAVLTQGFIASNIAGETVLLGRGGSDTSAAYFAAKLEAARLEIWTSVPGLFTANPHQISSARLLLHLDYEEAQELASSGAKVLHPQSISPVRSANVPLHLAWTENPDQQGTIVGRAAASSSPSVKAVSMKTGIQLISMDSVGMWQQAGFLADVFGCFKRYGLSIDLVATSESNVTVTLDRSANVLDDGILDNLIEELKNHCTPKSYGPCASVSLVGRNIRSIVNKLAPAFNAFENKKIYLISQSASDLNFTFVVDESDADNVIRFLHKQLFSEDLDANLFGPQWSDLLTGDIQSQALERPTPWWAARTQELLDCAQRHTPVYLYDLTTLQNRARQLVGMQAIDRVHYAVKANPNPQILRTLFAEGLHFDCVSRQELVHVLESVPGVDCRKILFTPNFAAANEYAFALENGCTITLDNVHPLEHHGSLFRGARILVRVDSGIAKGHHPHVITSGPKSKFGVSHEELGRIKELALKHGATIIGLHAHVGSGILTPETWADSARYLAELAPSFPDIEILDVGGGMGVVEKPGAKPLDIRAVDNLLSRFKDQYPRFKIWIEPGRYLVADAGIILSKVTQLKRKSGKTFVGLDVGMNSLIRPALYGAWHEIVNLSHYGSPGTMEADVVGPICESGDVLGHNRLLPETHEGDVFLIATAGAYGQAMASHYNLRPPAPDLFI